MLQKLFKYTLPLALGVLVLAGCKDDETTAAGEWNAIEDYADVSFVEVSTDIELDPTDPTSYTLHLSRRNPEITELRKAEAHLRDSLAADTTLTDDQRNAIIDAAVKRDSAVIASNWPALDVPVVITNLSENGNDTVFTVTPAHFDQSDEYGTFTINFPKAEIGKNYNVQLAVTDPKYVSYYSDAATATFAVSRVKWNLLGTGVFTDNFWYEESGNVEIYQKDNDHNVYRILKPFDEVASNAGETLTGKQSGYMILEVLQRNSSLAGVDITVDDLVYFSRTNTGYFHPNYGAYVEIFHPSDLYSSPTLALYEHSYVKKYNDDGSIGQVQLAPYYYMVGVGGWNNTTSDDIVLINFPGFVPKYTAELNKLGQEGDFQWDEVFEGIFTSAQLKTSTSAKVYKATCKVSTDQADSLFYEAYGDPYVIEAPYAEGYDIYFFVKNGRIFIPNDFAEKFELQELGVDAMGVPMYGKINGSSSYITDNEVMLNMTLQNKDGSIVINEGSNESLANITWTKVATGTFYYVMFAENDEGTPEPDPGYELFKRDDKDDLYKISDWLMGTDFMFTWNKTTNACEVLEQEINYVHPSYGMMYIIEGARYADKYAANTSYFDPATKVFHFFPAYFVEAGSFGQVEEFFEITEEGAVKRQTRGFGFGNPTLNAAIKKTYTKAKAKKQTSRFEGKGKPVAAGALKF